MIVGFDNGDGCLRRSCKGPKDDGTARIAVRSRNAAASCGGRGENFRLGRQPSCGSMSNWERDARRGRPGLRIRQKADTTHQAQISTARAPRKTADATKGDRRITFLKGLRDINPSGDAQHALVPPQLDPIESTLKKQAKKKPCRADQGATPSRSAPPCWPARARPIHWSRRSLDQRPPSARRPRLANRKSPPRPAAPEP